MGTGSAREGGRSARMVDRDGRERELRNEIVDGVRELVTGEEMQDQESGQA